LHNLLLCDQSFLFLVEENELCSLFVVVRRGHTPRVKWVQTLVRIQEQTCIERCQMWTMVQAITSVDFFCMDSVDEYESWTLQLYEMCFLGLCDFFKMFFIKRTGVSSFVQTLFILFLFFYFKRCAHHTQCKNMYIVIHISWRYSLRFIQSYYYYH
jgi:hypothetical protein